METSATPSQSTTPAINPVLAFGFYTSILIFVLTAATFAIAIFTPPISGPFCLEACIEYPYLDITSRFPRDYFWMYPAIVLSLLFVALLACLHRYAIEAKRIFSQIGLSFAVISATILIMDYFVQLAVIQPSLENGETAGISLLTQYNPHGIFIALEDIGYLMMSLALLCVVPVFSANNRVERAIRWVFISSFAVAISALVAFSIVYGVHREYRFEVVVISVVWLELIITGILTTILFRRAMRIPSDS